MFKVIETCLTQGHLWECVNDLQTLFLFSEQQEIPGNLVLSGSRCELYTNNWTSISQCGNEICRTYQSFDLSKSVSCQEKIRFKGIIRNRYASFVISIVLTLLL